MNLTHPFTHPRYQVKGALGKGGMGIVYQAFDRLTRQSVALKQVLAEPLLLQHNSQGDDPLLALATEFRVLAGLRHPHIVPVLDYGFDAARAPYYTMRLLENAQPFIEYGQSADEATKTRLMVELLQALIYLHRCGIIHRDLKPSNVLVDARGSVQVLDFGLALPLDAKTERRAQTAGTLAYMAPELFGNEFASRSSDLYAVGVMLYELWVGRHPFAAPNASFVLMDALLKPVDVVPLPPRLREVVAGLLAKAPAERPSQAEVVLRELCEALDVPPPPESLMIRESFLQASTFVGRAAEFDTLRGALSDMLAGGTAFWLVGGESGVGKSRLLDELRTRALIEGSLVLRGQAVEGGGLPFQLWREIARRLVLDTTLSELEASVLKAIAPDISELLERDVPDAPELAGKPGQDRLIFTLVEMLKRQTQPVVLLLEDLQWSGESLAPLYQLLLVREQLHHLLVVGTYRDDERPQLPDELAGMALLKLNRFDNGVMLELARGMLGEVAEQPQVVELLQRETEGNAFFMVETVRALAENAGSLAAIGNSTLPPTIFAGGVQRIVQRRLDQLPEAYHSLLRWAAVAGRQLDVAMLSHLADVVTVESFISAAANSNLLERVDDVWRFAHDKLREGVLHTLTADELSALHRAIAEAIEATYPANPSYDEALLGHWQTAGNTERELHYLLLVVELLEARSAYDEAKPLIARGLALVGENDPRLVTLLRWRTQIAFNQNDYATAWQLGQETLVHAQRLALPDEIAAALNNLGSVSLGESKYLSAYDYLQKSLDAYRSLNDQQGIARVLSRMGSLASDQSDIANARDYFEQSLSISRVIGDQRITAKNLTDLGILASQEGDYALAKEWVEQSLAIDTIIGNQRGIAVSLSLLGHIFLAQDDFAVAQDYCEQSLTLSRTMGYKSGIAVCLSNLAYIVLKQGDFATAQDYAQQNLTLARATDNQTDIAYGLLSLGIVAYEQGDITTAYSYGEQSLPLFRAIGFNEGLGEMVSFMAVLVLEQGSNKLLGLLHEGLNVTLKTGTYPQLLNVLVTTGRWKAPQHPVEAARLAGLIEGHRALNTDTRKILDKLGTELEALLPAVELAQYKAEGAALDLETTAREWLARIEAAL